MARSAQGRCRTTSRKSRAWATDLPDRADTSHAQRFTYDYRNRLIKVEASEDFGNPAPTWATVAEYLYDGLNRRTKKDLAAGTDIVYLYDGWRCIEERELDGETWEARRQTVHGGRYIDEVLIFDKDTDSDGDCTEEDGAGSKRYLYCETTTPSPSPYPCAMHRASRPSG